MYKIKTITFHHAHNFGSALQSYALQEFIKELGEENNISIDYQIIDFYTNFQQQFYSVLKKEISLKNIIKNVFALRYFKKLNKKHNKFEEFLKNKCNLSKRYKSEEELKKENIEADCLISGSDQIWNVRALDFEDVYYLNFVSNIKKISYAASFGPLKIDWNNYDKPKYQKYVNEYSYISVREEGSRENVEYLIGKKCDINVDPTLLLNKERWRKIQSDVKYNSGKYILLYCLEPTKKQLQTAKLISKKIGLPIVVLKYNNKNDMFNNFVKKYDSGPEDFLSYVDNAAMVLTTSFHGTVFSLIYGKPFYVLDGLNDNRIFNILKNTNLLDRSIENGEIKNVSLELIDNKKIDEYIDFERKKSKEYLLNALNFKQKEN